MDAPTTFDVGCRDGDLAMHFRWSVLAREVSILDLWYLRSGDRLTLTAMADRLPAWWRLHPTELVGGLVWKFGDRVKRGDYPTEPIEAPNLWRLRAGDTFALSRRDVDHTGIGLFVIQLELGAAVILDPVGEAVSGSVTDLMTDLMRAPPDPTPEEATERAARAVAAVRRAGLPRCWAEDWRMEH